MDVITVCSLHKCPTLTQSGINAKGEVVGVGEVKKHEEDIKCKTVN